MSVKELLQHVPPEVVYRRVPLDDDKNALGPWREALAHLLEPEDGSEEHDLWLGLIYGGGKDGDPVEFPAGDEGKPLRELLEKNRTTFEFMHEGVQRGRLQLPEFPEGDFAATIDDDGHSVVDLLKVSQAGFIKLEALWTDREFAAAAEQVICLLRMGEMICSGEGGTQDYMFGHWIRGGAARTVAGRFAGGDGVPKSVLNDLLSAVEQSLRQPDGLAECMRVYLCSWTLWQLDQLPHHRELEPFVDRLIEQFYHNHPMLAAPGEEDEKGSPTDERLIWRRQQLLSLLEGHPRPFDEIATARLLGEEVAGRICELSQPAKPKWFDLAGQCRFRRRLWWRRHWRKTRFWPYQLTAECLYEYLGHSEDARSQLNELHASMDPKDNRYFASLQPPTEADVAACRKRLRRIQNPVGWMLAEDLLDGYCSNFMSEYQTDLQQAKASLEERIGG